MSASIWIVNLAILAAVLSLILLAIGMVLARVVRFMRVTLATRTAPRSALLR